MTRLLIRRNTVPSEILNLRILLRDRNDRIAIALEVIGHRQVNVLSIPHHHSTISPKGLHILQFQTVGNDQEINRLHPFGRRDIKLVEHWWSEGQGTHETSIGSGNGVHLIHYIFHHLERVFSQNQIVVDVEEVIGIGKEGNHEAEEEGVVPVGCPEMFDGRILLIRCIVVMMHFALIENNLVWLDRRR